MQLQTMMDRMEITDLLGLYCRGLDRVDEATLRSMRMRSKIAAKGCSSGLRRTG